MVSGNGLAMALDGPELAVSLLPAERRSLQRSEPSASRRVASSPDRPVQFPADNSALLIIRHALPEQTAINEWFATGPRVACEQMTLRMEVAACHRIGQVPPPPSSLWAHWQ
jgi:hypothetical protein